MLHLIEHHDISRLSGFETPAKARYFYEYTGETDDVVLSEITRWAYQENLPILTIAGGKNLLLAFDEYPGLVIHNNSRGYRIMTNEEGIMKIEQGKMNNEEGIMAQERLLIQVASGHPVWELAESLENDQNIILWHRFLGLPGSVGGAVFGNAGCFGLEIGPYVERVYIIDMKTGDRIEKTVVELDFNYRWSECKNHPEWFITSVVFDLSELREKYAAPEEDPLHWRERVQPQGFSCGSFFKNPSRERTAGLLLDEVGLRGRHIGGAYFSEKHANFLMSDGTATWRELLELIELAQTSIVEFSGINLEPEVRIIIPLS